MNKKKINPRRKPATHADLEKAKKSVASEMVEMAQVILFSVLRDKEGATTEDLHRIWGEVNDLSDSISQGYVKISDLKNTLKQEEGLVLRRG